MGASEDGRDYLPQREPSARFFERYEAITVPPDELLDDQATQAIIARLS